VPPAVGLLGCCVASQTGSASPIIQLKPDCQKPLKLLVRCAAQVSARHASQATFAGKGGGHVRCSSSVLWKRRFDYTGVARCCSRYYWRFLLDYATMVWLHGSACCFQHSVCVQIVFASCVPSRVHRSHNLLPVNAQSDACDYEGDCRGLSVHTQALFGSLPQG
jgi:hypothetical protein